jgi:excisionase family DNA binding protein
MQTLMTLDDVAEAIKVDPEFLLALIRRGELRGYRLGDSLRIRETDLEKFLETCVHVASADDPGPERHAQAAPLDPRGPTEPAREPSSSTTRMVPAFGGRTTVKVLGSVAEGASIWMGKARYPLKFSKDFFEALLSRFRGQTVKAGTSFSVLEPGSLGEWIKRNRGIQMNPTYAIAGLLINEGYAERPKPGYIRFVEQKQEPR